MVLRATVIISKGVVTDSKLNLDDMPTGVYFLMLEDSKQRLRLVKI